MTAKLEWAVDKRGFIFTCHSEGKLLPIDQWAMRDIKLENQKRARIGPILVLIETEVAEIEQNNSVLISHKAIANLESYELSQLGLPPPMPFSLHIHCEVPLSHSNFRFKYAYVTNTMRPVMGTERIGALLKVGKNQYVLSDPFFSIIESIDSFNTAPPGNLETKFLVWATIKEYLTDDIVVGDYLKSLRIIKADAFTVFPFVNRKGEPDFKPILLNYDYEEPFDDTKNHVKNALPRAPQESFQEQFKKFSNVRMRYALPGSWYVVLPESLRKALQVVKEIHQTNHQTRSEFLLNPLIFLKQKLEDEISEEVLESLFVATEEYSDRVKGIGIWKPPVIPYLVPAKEPFLPPEEIGIRVADQLIRIDPQEVGNLLERIRNAIASDKNYVEFNGEKIPASIQTIEALEALVPEIKPTIEYDNKKRIERRRIALLIRGNLDVLDFTYSQKNRDVKNREYIRSLRSHPLPHQESGIEWLKEHWIKGSHGVLLADDMGLGKTLQVLIFMSWIKQQVGDNCRNQPMLVVAPTGLLRNWVDEHEKHFEAPGLGIPEILAGGELRKWRSRDASLGKELDMGLPVLDLERLQRADWILTSYETLRDYQHSFGRVRWAVLVFDEAQKIKNPTSLVTHAAKAMNADFIIALTGTPVENRLADLWCIIDTVQPGRLGSLKEFISLYEREDENSCEKLQELKFMLTRENQQNQLPPIMLRREKKDNLKGLPPKCEHRLKRMMPEVQANEYKKIVTHARSGKRRKGRVLEVLHALRSVSLHPFLKNGESDEEYIKSSARLDITFEILDNIAAQDLKALIFVESLKMQGILAELIQRRYNLVKPILIINGQVSGRKRKQRVRDFQERSGFDVMILSPKAGGVGLTLTAANHVIHLSRWWNPAVEDQCSDRVYRIGQSKEVQIYYPMAIHPDWVNYSFDLRLDELLERKRELSRTILVPPVLSKEEVENLYHEIVEHDIVSETFTIDPGEMIDLLEPLAFEELVFKCLKKQGYKVRRTPISWDRGADGIAIASDKANKPNLIFQCKHTQTGKPCGIEAVKALIDSLKHYRASELALQPIIITNAERFSKEAIEMAAEKRIRLVCREELIGWVVDNG